MGEFILNGINYGGSVVTPNPSGAATDTLTKVGIDGDVYDFPSGGSTNSYGYNVPSDSEGANGDIYCKISDISGEDECVDSTITFAAGTWTAVPLLRDSAAYTSFVMSGSYTLNGITNNYAHTYQDTSTIGTSEDTATTLYGPSNSNRGKMYKSGSSLYVYNTTGTFRISSLVGTYTDAHAVNNIYQKVEGSWAKSTNSSEDNYSTDEQRIGTWIDGKPLYQITKKIDNDELWADLTYYGLSVTDLDFVAVKEATFVDPSNSVYASLPYHIPSTNNYIEVGMNVIDSIKRLTIRTNTTFSATTGRYIVATIIYTKTTD